MKPPRQRSFSLAGLMVGVVLAGLALAAGRAINAPPRIQALAAALIGLQYLVLFVIVFVLGPSRPKE